LKDLGLVREVGRGAKNCLVVQLSEAGRKVAEKLG
jgi:hypothetical protein